MEKLSSHRRPVVLLTLGLFAVAIVLVTLSASQKTDEARTRVKEYYAAFERGDHAQMWNFFSAQRRQDTPQADFARELAAVLPKVKVIGSSQVVDHNTVGTAGERYGVAAKMRSVPQGAVEFRTELVTSTPSGRQIKFIHITYWTQELQSGKRAWVLTRDELREIPSTTP